jgi:hypothetical protein
MRKLTCFLLLCVVAGCENYQEPRANCFSFVSQGPTPLDCSFEALGNSNSGDISNE